MSKITEPIATDKTLTAVRTELQGIAGKLSELEGGTKNATLAEVAKTLEAVDATLKNAARDETLQSTVQALQGTTEKIGGLTKDTTVQGVAEKLNELQAVAKDETLQGVTKSLEDKDAILLRMAEALDAKDTTAERLAEIKTAGDEQKQQIKSVGEQVRATIPEDYSTLSEKVNNTSNALKGTAAGDGAVGMHDTSSVEHIMSVKVRSKNVSDLTAVSVKKYGKNMIGTGVASDYEVPNKQSLTITENSVTAVSGSGGSSYLYNRKFKYAPGKYAVSCKSTETPRLLVQCCDESGNALTDSDIAVSGWTYNSYYKGWYGSNQTVEIPDTAAYWNFGWVFNGTTGADVTVSDILVARDTEDITYEPYIEPVTYIPTADGTLEGVTSLYPSTTLATDTDGVIIDCEYNRDINKAFEELTNAIISLGGNV